MAQKVKKDLRKSKRTGLLLKRIQVKMPDGGRLVVDVFVRGCREMEELQIFK